MKGLNIMEQEIKLSLHSDNKLVCPECGDTYLHQTNVTVFDREEEDGKVIVREISTSEVKTSYQTNAHGRRNSLEIKFYGECGHEFILLIMQHKGETFLEVLDLKVQEEYLSGLKKR